MRKFIYTLFVFVFLSSVAFGQSKLGKWSVEDKNKVRDEIKEFIPDKKTQDCIISSMEKEYESFYDANSDESKKNVEKLESLMTDCLTNLQPINSSKKIQELINNASDGEIISIPEGEYIIDESLLIHNRKGLSLRGNGKCRILLTDLWKEVLDIKNSNSIKIEGIYFSHLKPLKEYECNGGVIGISSSSIILIDNCELEGSGTIGVAANDVENLKVSNCYIHDNTFNAFYLSDVNNARIYNCVIKNNANMLQSYKLTDFEMSDNMIMNNGGYWREKSSTPGLRKEK